MKDYIPEEFKPIPVRKATGVAGSIGYGARLVVDLQLLTCTRFLKSRLANVRGTLIDVGCGEMPFRDLLHPAVQYTGIDVPEAISFGMRNNIDIIPFDGINIPFPDASCDAVLCTEVLEHVADPASLVAEMYRVLRPGGLMIATVPFAARVHHAPYDFHRFTRFRLSSLFSSFSSVEVVERGNDITVIANKLVVLCARLLRSKSALNLFWTLPVVALLAPFTLVALGCAHLSLMVGGGSKNDPLGYGILACKD
ncbi:class I SAM-dependent methyltransferase [Rhizobium rhizogenes]|uniref:Class I SAM-dependent methyltransferase n=1 Tax=Rhizobium rhizogenes TaxID=359 RepID=A0AA88EVD3_RHIRH|nr:class I SAM-dependent methyltransferase [Rhizobium rhizogenes]KAA3498034.1 class I SAM-dependent methyltransferase [Rhizobium rhizogenes]